MVRVILTTLVALVLVACAAPHGAERHYVQPVDIPYRLDSGDELRVVVFDQANLTDTYRVDAEGRISMPLIGTVHARGRTLVELGNAITAALRDGFLRDPSVSIQVETHRPFFILGEVGAPGQYPYVADMTAEQAVAISGGFSSRAVKSHVRLTRTIGGETAEAHVPIHYPVAPGDTVTVIERWF